VLKEKEPANNNAESVVTQQYTVLSCLDSAPAVTKDSCLLPNVPVIIIAHVQLLIGFLAVLVAGNIEEETWAISHCD